MNGRVHADVALQVAAGDFTCQVKGTEYVVDGESLRLHTKALEILGKTVGYTAEEYAAAAEQAERILAVSAVAA